MCMLVKGTEEFRIADKPITVYKMLYRRDCGGYMTPFQQTGVPSTARGEEMRAKGELRREYECHGLDSVTCGVIHTYSNVYAAVEEARFQNRWDDTTKHHVFEMVIPEGERYIVSRDGREKGTLSCRFVRRLTHEETDRLFKEAAKMDKMTVVKSTNSKEKGGE